MADYAALSQAYFDAWNTNDAAKLGPLFADGVRLKDWNVDVSGKQAVVDANGGIFKDVPGIKITVDALHPSPTTSTCTCQISVVVNPETTLSVVDVIGFDADGKISSVIAYTNSKV